MDDFLRPKTIEELVAEQRAKPFGLDSFKGDLTEQDVDELLEAIHETRNGKARMSEFEKLVFKYWIVTNCALAVIAGSMVRIAFYLAKIANAP
jgi:hypothetical protein